MSPENLSHKKLDHITLAGAHLSEADLSHASLRHAHLEGAELQHANLSESDLEGAHLNHADVTGAVLCHAKLTGADLRGVDLDRAATAEGADLRGAKGVSPEIIEKTAQADDRVVSLHWHDEADADRIEYVARSLARAGGFHEVDWTAALTEQERQWYRRDARAAITATREYEQAHAPGHDREGGDLD